MNPALGIGESEACTEADKEKKQKSWLIFFPNTRTALRSRSHPWWRGAESRNLHEGEGHQQRREVRRVHHQHEDRKAAENRAGDGT